MYPDNYKESQGFSIWAPYDLPDEEDLEPGAPVQAFGAAMTYEGERVAGVTLTYSEDIKVGGLVYVHSAISDRFPDSRVASKIDWLTVGTNVQSILADLVAGKFFFLSESREQKSYVSLPHLELAAAHRILSIAYGPAVPEVPVQSAVGTFEYCERTYFEDSESIWA